jgi:class 3 adenylate cyclase
MSPGFLALIILAQNGPPNSAVDSAPNVGAILLLIPLIVLALIAFAFALRRWKNRRAARAANEPSCGRCGYLVKGLTTFTCPECGSDLRDVGIVSHAPPGVAAARRPRSRAAIFFRVVGWKLVLVAILVTVGAALAIDYYDDYLRPNTRFETQTIHGVPYSRGFTAVTATLTERVTTKGNPRYTYRYSTPDVSQLRVTVEIQKGPDRFLFVRDVLAGTNTYLTVDGIEHTTRAPLGQEFRDWMRDHGVDVNNPAVSAEILSIANAVGQADKQNQFFDLMANGTRPHFNIDSIGVDGKDEGTTAYYVTATSIAVAVGLAALAIVWLRNRRRLATALAARQVSVVAAEKPAPAATATAPTKPAPPPIVRTLTVMFSDVKDYTARTATESRLGVLNLVRRHRDLVQPIAKRRGGRIVKSLGDGLLLTFDSATDAVLAGLEIQSAAADHNKSAFADRDKLELRIAVSTGEVALHDDDVFGDAVNLASRAQQHATPGEVIFTDATRATINRREIQFADAGTHQIKGIEDPVALYRAVPTTAAQPAP